jgi:hypothetical protein
MEVHARTAPVPHNPYQLAVLTEWEGVYAATIARVMMACADYKPLDVDLQFLELQSMLTYIL